MKYTLFLSCIRGFEEYCKQELQDLGIEEPVSVDGGIQFNGDLSDIYKINCSSRHGMYLYSEIAKFSFDEKKLYNNIYNISWDKYLNNIHSFAIKVNSTDRRLNSQYTALVIKDGIADYFTKNYGRRPNVDKRNPDIPIYAYIHNNHIKLYIDTSGAPLYKRGYRTNDIHEAPLNEVLAANIISSMTLDNQMLYDPMCGSGTLLIEAAMKSLNVPAQICRDNFAFMNWFNYDPELYDKTKRELKDSILNKDILFCGSDTDETSLKMISGSVSNLNLEKNFTVRRRNFYEFIPKSNSTIIFNPPYDIRIAVNKDLDQFYEKIGNKLKENCSDSTVFIFTIDTSSLEYIDIPCIKSIKFKNGNLNCLLNKYTI